MIKASAFKSHDVILSVLERPCSCVKFRVTRFLLPCFLQHFFAFISLFILHDNFLIFSSISILFNSEGIYQEFSISRFLDIVKTDNCAYLYFSLNCKPFSYAFPIFLLRFPFYPSVLILIHAHIFKMTLPSFCLCSVYFFCDACS